LPYRVNACIGASTSHDGNVGLFKLDQRPLDFALDRWLMLKRLALKAMIARSVIRDSGSVSHSSSNSSNTIGAASPKRRPSL